MKIVYGWSLVCATLLASTAWGQAAQPQTAQPASPTQGQGAPATRNAQGGADQEDDVRAPGGRRVQGQAGAQGGRQGGEQGGQRAQWSDAQIAALLAGGNRNEIEISKFAQDKLQTDDAKEFAAMMIKEHTPVLQKLQQLAGPAMQGGGQRRGGGAANSSDAVGGGNRGAEGGDDAADAVRRPREGAAGAGAEGGAGGGQQRRGVNWTAFHRELADQCLESTKEMLGEHKGIDFDKAYLGQQIVAHQEMVDKLTVAQKHASSEMQQDIEQQLTSAKQHLEHVKKVMEDKKDQEPREGQKSRGAQKSRSEE